MTERTPEAELHPCERVLILDTWAAHPVFHAGVLYFTDDEPPNGTSFADRIAAPMPDLPWRHNALTTRCGNLLRVHLWLEDVTVRKTGSEAVADHRWSTPYSFTELRFDHAASFARACRRCWPHTPPTT